MSSTMRTRPLLRARIAWITVAIGAIAVGLASRKFGGSIPPFLATYAGDTLWASVVFAIAGAIAPAAAMPARAIGALAFAVAIELSQLSEAAWLVTLRETTLGALVLGRGFLWSDLACYAAGIALGVVGETIARCARHNHRE